MAVTQTSVGPTSAGTGRSDSTNGGAVAWTLPTAVNASDGTKATSVLNAQTSEYLLAYNFGFAIPGHATIDGILVEIERSTNLGTVRDVAVYLVRQGRVQASGDNKAAAATDWPVTASEAYASYGGTADLWGFDWTPADINDPFFGVIISAREVDGVARTASVDHVRITVTYTPGYDAVPRVLDGSEFQLGGRRYRIAREEKGGGAGRVHETLATVFPQRTDIGGPNSRPSNPVIDTYEVNGNDLKGGMGLWRYRDAKDMNRYWTGDSIDPIFILTAGPLVTGLSTPDASTVASRHLARHTSETLLVYVLSGVIYNYNLGTSAWTAAIDTLPGAVLSPPVYANGRLFYAQGTAGYSYHTAAGSVATDVATPTFVDFQKYDNKLYGIDVSGILYSSPADGVAANMGNAANWTTLATIPNEWAVVSGYNEIYDLDVYDDPSGDPIVYCRTSMGLWSYDQVNDKWFKTRLSFPRSSLSSAAFGSLGAVYRGQMFNQAGLRDIAIYDARQPIGDDRRSLGLPDGLPTKYQAEIHAWETDYNLLYVLAGDSFEDATVDHVIYVYTGGGWHPLVTLSNPNYTWSSAVAKRPPGAMKAIAMNSTFRLYIDVGGASGATNNTMSWIDLSALSQHPLQSTTRKYVASSSIEFPYFDAYYPSQIKSAQNLRIKLLGAGPATGAPTETVQVAYRLNGSTSSYTNLGSAISVNTEVTIPFGTNNVGLSFHSIQFRLTFASAGSTLAPKMEYFAMDFIRNPEVQRGFTTKLDLSQDAPDGRSPAVQYRHLWSAMKSDVFLTAAWRDDAGNTRSYLVKMMRPEGSFNTGADYTGEFGLQLMEMGAN